MNKDFYSEQIARLEKIFGRCPAPDEYFNTFHNFRPEDFIKAIDTVLETHRPYTGRIFPSPSTILDALNDMMQGRPWGTPEDQVDAEYCDKCRNSGMYLEGNTAKFCDCINGKKAQIVFQFWPDHKKIAEEQGRVRNAAPPHHGLKERNPLGFWEDTKEEHDRWMAAKRAEIEEMKERSAQREARLLASKKIIVSESLAEVVKEIIHQVDETRPLREIIKEEVLDRKEKEEDPFPMI
jgi:hypothetical protein